MHLSDGILPAPVLGAGFVLAGTLAARGATALRDEEIPRVAVFTATFFCASLLHFKVPPTSVHLLLHGLLGVVLGRRVLLALPIGLALQALLLGHGGISTLGVNSVVFGLSALAAHGVFRLALNRAGCRPFLCGAAAGACAVLLSALSVTGLLVSAGEGFRLVAQYALIAHLPILILEALVTGLTVEFLQRVQPSLLAATTP